MSANASSYARVNGVDLYYEISGSGVPLVLLHGGMGTTGMFAPYVPALACTRQVIAVELQGHGHTADVERPLSFESMADDIAALLRQLGIAQADLFGYSLGGGVALQTAIRHPEAVRKLVLLSTVFKRQGWFPESLAGMDALNAAAAAALMQTPIYQAYVAAAPRPAGWPVLVTKVGQLLRKEYDWSAAVAAIRSPALIVVGDADSLHLEHAVEMYRLFGGGKVDGFTGGIPASQLAVLPGTTHISAISRADLLLPVIMPFLGEG